MDKNEEVTGLLTEIRDLLKQGRTSQLEAIEFLREAAERSKAMVDRSVALQETAMRRQKGILVLVIPLLVLCLAALAYVMLGFGRYYR